MRALVRQPMDSIWTEMERLFSAPLAWHGAVPPVDVEETDEAFVITAELPGFQKNNIDVELAGDVLTIRGERVEKEGRKFLRRERASSVTRFERRFQLPGPIRHDGVNAAFTKGELVITLPKAERKSTYKIPLN